eukprot:m.61810 g.61810  ORF g.61810 m.61810 type:complete len:549 (-) comp8048_c0_seq1:4976-6622(-)
MVHVHTHNFSCFFLKKGNFRHLSLPAWAVVQTGTKGGSPKHTTLRVCSRCWVALRRHTLAEVVVDTSGGRTPLGNRPHHERLASSAVTGRKESALRCLKRFFIRLEVTAIRRLDRHAFNQLLLRSHKPKGQQHAVGLNRAFTAFHFRHVPPTIVVFSPHDIDEPNALDVALAIVHKFFGEDLVLARVTAVNGADFLVSIVNLKHAWKRWPRVVIGASLRVARHEFEVDNRCGAQTDRRANAVVARVATANHDHLLALDVNKLLVLVLGIQQAFGVGTEKIHGEMHPTKLPAGNGQVTRYSRSRGEQDGIKTLAEFVQRRVDTDFDIGLKDNAFFRHEVHAPLHNIHLVALHVGDTVHHEPANAIGTLQHRHRVPGLVELVGGGHPGRTRPDNADGPLGAHGGRLGDNPSFFKPTVNNGALNLFDRDGVFNNTQDARAFARRWAHTPRKLGKVVGGQQRLEGRLVIALVHQVVPLRDTVTQRAPTLLLVAKRDPTVHAPGCLRLEKLRRLVAHGSNLLPVPNTRLGITVPEHFTAVFDKPTLLDRLGNL